MQAFECQPFNNFMSCFRLETGWKGWKGMYISPYLEIEINRIGNQLLTRRYRNR